jgi:hypothetical protein
VERSEEHHNRHGDGHYCADDRVGWVFGTARWRCPKSVVITPIVDLNVPLPLSLAWRKDNSSPLLTSFVGEVQRLPDVRALK